MNYLSVESLAKSYGAHELFQDLTFGIQQGQKVGLVAQNGAGKTSLLRLLSGDEQPDSGRIVYRKDLTVVFLSQEVKIDESLTIEQAIFDSATKTNGKKAGVIQAIESYEKALLDPENGEALQRALDLMDAEQGWDFETLYKQILSRLELHNTDQKVSTLSGGQKKRLALAQALVCGPDLLILDEPTNHLDLAMIEWLEDYLSSSNMTLFMVTHDRYFLDRVCQEILELDQQKFHLYKGNYAYYLEKRQARIEQFDTESGKAKQLFSKELAWMRRQPKARTTKSKSRIDDFAQIKARAQERRNDHEIQLEFMMDRLGNKIAEFHHVHLSRQNNLLLEDFSYRFQKGERLGIIGANGSGKSSFLELLTGGLLPDQGKVIWGDTIKFGYFKQDGLPEYKDKKVIDIIRDFGEYIPLKKGRQLSASELLQRFLFDRKKQYDSVDKLSGGEKKRLFLCTVLIQNPNFLILDEPTNDLDVMTINVLEQFLLDFPGCLIVVSHDRFFMDKVVDHLFVFQGAGQIDDFPGNYSDFRSLNGPVSQRSNKPEKIQDSSEKLPKAKSGLSYLEQKEFQKLERAIEKLERERETLQQQFASEDWSLKEINDQSMALEQIIANLDQNTERWFALSAKIDAS
jgi:ABC transport system ATP-binding/permease protein